MPMIEIAEKSRADASKRRIDLWEWARHHRAAVAMGLIVFATLCFLPISPHRQTAVRVDLASDGTPLFI